MSYSWANIIVADTYPSYPASTSSQSNYIALNGDTIRITDTRTISSASASGNQGEICYDSNYIYVCVGSNTWKRASLASW